MKSSRPWIHLVSEWVVSWETWDNHLSFSPSLSPSAWILTIAHHFKVFGSAHDWISPPCDKCQPLNNTSQWQGNDPALFSYKWLVWRSLVWDSMLTYHCLQFLPRHITRWDSNSRCSAQCCIPLARHNKLLLAGSLYLSLQLHKHTLNSYTHAQMPTYPLHTPWGELHRHLHGISWDK